MMMQMKLRRVLMGAAFAAVGLSPAAYAEAGNTIDACANNSSGNVKIVTANTVCPKKATLTTWNIVGPKGAAGPSGGPGPVGPAGAPGATQDPQLRRSQSD
jgi:hypothetical protein